MGKTVAAGSRLRHEFGETALIDAALRDHEEAVTRLISEGVDVEVANVCGNTALHYAAFFGRSAIVKLLLEAGAHVDATTPNEVTPLHMAANQGHEDVVRLLIDNGAKIEAKTSTVTENFQSLIEEIGRSIPETVRMNTCGKGATPLYEAALHGQTAVVKCLLQLGADATTTDTRGETPLIAAAHSALHNTLGGPMLPLTTTRSSATETAFALLKHGVDVNATSKLNCSALHVAARCGLLDLIRHLVRRGANVTARTLNGDVPLHYAARSGQVEVVEWFMSQGLNPHIRNNEGCTVLHLAASNGNVETLKVLLDRDAGFDIEACDGRGMSPLMRSVCSKKPENVQLLLDRGANVDRETSPYTGVNAAFFALQNEQVEILSIIIDHGAKLDVLSHLGTLLHVAAQTGKTKVLPILIEKGLSQTATTQHGKTALHLAAWYGKTEAVQCLLDSGSEIDAVDDYGQTPLQLAVSNGEQDTVSLLCQRGSNVNQRWKDGPTILDVALQHKHVTVARFLVSQGANNLDRVRMLHTIEKALSESDCSILQFLIENDKDSIFMSSECPSTLFHAAVQSANEDFIRFLVDRGFDIEGKDINGNSALRAAVKARSASMVELLLECGARDVSSLPNDNVVVMALDLREENIAICLIQYGVTFNYQDILMDATQNALEEVVGVLVCECDDDAYDRNLDEALHNVLYKGHVGICRLLLENGADANSQLDTGQRPLHLSCFEDDIECATLLLDHGANIEARDKRWRTPLMCSESLLMTKMLVGRGADVKATDNDDWTALHHGVEGLGLDSKEASDDTDMIEFLISEGADLNAPDDNGNTPLHIACSGHSLRAVQTLIAKGAKVDAHNANGDQPLHIALKGTWNENGDENDSDPNTPYFDEDVILQILDVLLQHGADINASGEGSSTALHIVVGRHYSAGICKWLLDQNANIEAIDEKDDTPLMRACFRHDPGFCIPTFLTHGIDKHIKGHRYRDALDRALDNGDWKSANNLLQCGVTTDPNQDREKSISIFSCMRARYTHLLSFILSSDSIDIEEKDRFGYTPLGLAAKNEDMQYVEILLEHGADPDANGPCTCGGPGHNRSVLLVAAGVGSTDVLRALLDAGADVNKVNHHNSTALTIAAEHGHVECLNMLLDAPGIDVNIVDNDGDSALICAVHGNRPETTEILLARDDVDRSFRNNRGFTAEELAQTRSRAVQDLFKKYSDGGESSETDAS